jgi:hypothetical protein
MAVAEIIPVLTFIFGTSKTRQRGNKTESNAPSEQGSWETKCKEK